MDRIMLTRDEITKLLNQEVYAADARLKAAREIMDAIIADTPSMLPTPDGQHRLENAFREHSKACEALALAVKRNGEFTLHRIVPEDLK